MHINATVLEALSDPELCGRISIRPRELKRACHQRRYLFWRGTVNHLQRKNTVVALYESGLIIALEHKSLSMLLGEQGARDICRALGPGKIASELHDEWTVYKHDDSCGSRGGYYRFFITCHRQRRIGRSGRSRKQQFQHRVQIRWRAHQERLTSSPPF